MRFSQNDLELFRDASGDRNPLHLSKQYASRTAYGQQVVFGALGAVACLGQLSPKSGRRIARMAADFHRPMFLDVDYSIKQSGSDESLVVRLLDGSVPVLTLSIHYAEGAPAVEAQTSPRFERTEAKQLAWEDISVGLEFAGQYRSDPAKLAELGRRWNVSTSWEAVEAFLWSSYVVGMELPGRNALFFRVALEFRDGVTTNATASYRLKVASANKSISQLKINAEFTSAAGIVASGQLVAFVRPEISPTSFADLASASSRSLEGKVVLVVGASRGLGAALTACIATEGAQVIALSRSSPEFTGNLPDEIGQRISVESVDAADSDSLAMLRDRLVERFGRLDFPGLQRIPSDSFASAGEQCCRTDSILSEPVHGSGLGASLHISTAVE